MRNASKWVTFCGLFVMASFLTGCLSVHQPQSLKDSGLKPGEPITEEQWAKIDELGPQGNVLLQKRFSWLLPLNIYSQTMTRQGGGESIWAERFTWNGLGFPMFFLPYRVVYANSSYDRSQDEPVGKEGLIWWPLYTDRFSEGDPSGNVQIDADGIPLFFSRVRADTGDFQAQFWNVLWTLGPACLTAEATDPRTDETAEVYLAAPLLLGGVLGTILWTDVSIKNANAQESIMMHGPLFGILGYYQIKQRAVEMNEDSQEPAIVGRESVHGLVGGALWNDYTRRDLDGELVKARYGPLWTGFGWQWKEDRFGLRFLWIPIQF